MFLEVCWLPGSAQCAEPGLVLALKECFEQFVSDDTRGLWHRRYSSSPLTPTGAWPRAPPAHRLVASTAVMSAPGRQFVKSALHDVTLHWCLSKHLLKDMCASPASALRPGTLPSAFAIRPVTARSGVTSLHFDPT